MILVSSCVYMSHLIAGAAKAGVNPSVKSDSATGLLRSVAPPFRRTVAVPSQPVEFDPKAALLRRSDGARK